MNKKAFEIEILKRNQRYFVAKITNGDSFKLEIDQNSEDLQVGDKELLQVEYVSGSFNSKSGVIYRLSEPLAYQTNNSPVVLKACYNTHLIDDCRKLGGFGIKAKGHGCFLGF